MTGWERLHAGWSNQRIAHDLVVALDTAKRHATHVLGKHGAANRTEGRRRPASPPDPPTPPRPARYHLRVRDHRAASFHPAGTFE